jgi:hypothetical protein
MEFAMRRLFVLMVSLFAVLSVPLPAKADFIKDYRQWQQLGPDGQAAYAMGIFDVMTVLIANDEYSVARSIGLKTCAITLQLRAKMVAQAITQFYKDHPESQIAGPFVAFNGYFERGACSPFINKAREEMGLKPMLKAPLPDAPAGEAPSGQAPAP